MKYLDKIPGSNAPPPNWPDAERADGSYNGLMLAPAQIVSDTMREIESRHTGAPTEQKTERDALK